MQRSPATPSSSDVLRFVHCHDIDIGSEVVEWTQDELRGLNCYALLNNDVVLMDAVFAEKFRHQHASDRKVNKVKLNDGLICVAGEDQKVTFYDPLVPQPVKTIASTHSLTSKKRSL